MTRKRMSKEEKQQRHEWAMKQIDKGVGFSELASLISETWGCTRRNACHVLSLAHNEWMEIAYGAEEIDQRDLLFKCIARLERTARKAEEAGNYACVIGAVAQMNRMLSLVLPPVAPRSPEPRLPALTVSRAVMEPNWLQGKKPMAGLYPRGNKSGFASVHP